MRISDWSSDVCSSDLGPRDIAEDDRIAFVAGAPDGVGIGIHGDEGLAVPLKHLRHHAAYAAEADDDGSAVVPLFQKFQSRVAQAVPAPGDVAAKPGEQWRDRKSTRLNPSH